MKGRVFEIREFCLHDGPGPRTTVFLQGCPLRCTWCQNPEGQEKSEERGGKSKGVMEAEEVAREIAKTADFLVASGGGVTFSGGEPLCQPDFICEIIAHLTSLPPLRSSLLALPSALLPSFFALETSGYAPLEDYQRVVAKMNLVLQDVKLPDLDGYRKWTGVDATPIFRNLEWLKTSGVPFIARIPTMPGVNDSREAKAGIVRLLEGAPNLQRIELLPYNPLAGAKYAKLGRVYAPGFDETRKPDLSTDVFAARGFSAVAL